MPRSNINRESEGYSVSAIVRSLAQYGFRPGDGDSLNNVIVRYGEAGAECSTPSNPVLSRLCLNNWLIRSRRPVYKPLNDYADISLPGAVSLVKGPGGGVLVAACQQFERRVLWTGVDIVEELKRYLQGDPEKVRTTEFKGGLGFNDERPIYLYESQLDEKKRSEPWADNLGFSVAEQLSRMTDVPLIESLPEGLKGLVILTADDDQAYLEKYDEQLAVLGDVPVTYFLHPLTKHTSATLARLPRHVEIGVHPDALDEPENYDRLCEAQTEFVRRISQKPVRIVRNHGFLNRGYWGHLKAWETCGLELDVNLPGVDGTALNGSFLPFRVQKEDGALSSHYSLLTAFGDGMVFALGMTDRQAARRIRAVSRQIEKTNPGVLVFNLHPQNIDSTRHIHKEVVKLAHRKGWKAIGLESFLHWLKAIEALSVERTSTGCILRSESNEVATGVVLRIPLARNGWKRLRLKPWRDQVIVSY